jgi:hypothetical protein
MKSLFITLLVLSLFMFINTAHTQESRQSLVHAINKLETTLEKILHADSQRIFVSMKGIVEEWDTSHTYRMIYDVREIDLTEVNIVQISDRSEAALLLNCKIQDNCVKVEEKDKKVKYFNQIYAFTLPIEKQRHLAEIYELLVEIQQSLPKR